MNPSEVLIPIVLFIKRRRDGDWAFRSRGVRQAHVSAVLWQPSLPPDVTARLERMEQAIDSIAVRSSAFPKASDSRRNCSPSGTTRALQTYRTGRREVEASRMVARS